MDRGTSPLSCSSSMTNENEEEVIIKIKNKYV